MNNISVDDSVVEVEVVDEIVYVNVNENIVEIEISETGPQGPAGPAGAKGDKGDPGAGIAYFDAPITYDEGTSTVGLQFDPATLEVGVDGLTVVGGINGGDADTLDGHDSSYFINTSSTTQTKDGNLILSGTGTMEVLDLNETSITSKVTNIPVTTPVQIDAFSASLYRSAEYILQFSQGSNYSISKLLLIHNGADVAITEYGQVSIGSHIPYDFSASYALNNLEVTIQCPNANTTPVSFKFSRVLFDA